MQGIHVFRSLEDALAAGYHLYDRTSHGYLVRINVDGRWRIALVDLPAEAA